MKSVNQYVLKTVNILLGLNECPNPKGLYKIKGLKIKISLHRQLPPQKKTNKQTKKTKQKNKKTTTNKQTKKIKKQTKNEA